jgi:hypothetical protein
LRAKWAVFEAFFVHFADFYRPATAWQRPLRNPREKCRTPRQTSGFVICRPPPKSSAGSWLWFRGSAGSVLLTKTAGPYIYISREYTYGNWQFCHGKRAAVCFGTFPAK